MQKFSNVLKTFTFQNYKNIKYYNFILKEVYNKKINYIFPKKPT